MAYNRFFSPKFLVLLPLLAVLMVGLACGGDSEPVATPTLQPTATPVDVAAITQALTAAIQGSIEEALKKQEGETDEPISPEELQQLVERAVEASVPPGTSPLEIQQMVQQAIEASSQPGLSTEDVASLIAQTIAESSGEELTAEDVRKIVEQAVATSTPLPIAAVTFEWEQPTWVRNGKYGGVLPMSSLNWRINWDPHQQTGLLDSAVSSGFYSQLMRWDYQDRDKLIGDLVKTWELTADGGYLFKLYEGATFLDGESVNADDVKFSLDRMVEEGRPRPKTGKIRRYYDGSEVIDDRTIKVNLKIPSSPAFLQFLAVENFKVIGKHVGDAHPDLDERAEFLNNNPQNINGSGPFMFKDFQEGVLVEWEKNPDYWKEGMPFLDGIRMFLIEDANRLVPAYKTEQVLMPNFGDTGMGVRDLTAAQEQWGNQIVVHWLGAPELDVLFVNFEKPPFDNPDVRQAFYVGIDRVEHINTLLDGRGKMGTPFFPDSWMTPSDEVVGTWPGFRYVDKDSGEPVLVPYDNDNVMKDPRDIQLAKELLAKAGYTEDNPLKFTYNAFALPYHSSVAQLMREQFKRFGVEAEINPRDVASGFADTRAGSYQMSHVTRAGDIRDSDDLLLGNYMPGGVSSWENIDIPEINEIFRTSSREADPDIRQEQIRRAGDLLRQNGKTTQIGVAWVDRYALPVNSKVKNFRVGRLLGENYIHESIWLEDPIQFN